MFFYGYEYAEFFKLFDKRLAAFVTVHAVVLASTLAHRTIVVDDLNLFEVVALTHFKVVGVVSRRNLNSTSPEFLVDIFIGKQRNAAVHNRQNQGLAHDILITFIFRMYRYARITEHGFGSGRGDFHIAILALYLIAQMPEMTVFIFMFHFDIGNGRVAVRAPVGNARPLIDKALVIQAYEHFAHSRRAAFIHRETLAVPVTGRPQRTQLGHDAVAILFLPVPNAFEELFAAEFITVRSLFTQRSLNLGLRSDTGMVTARNPNGIVALHAAETNQNILQRIVKGMPHMQLPRDIWRRDNHAVRLLALIHLSME